MDGMIESIIAALLLHTAWRALAYNRANRLLVGCWRMHDYVGSVLSRSPHPLATLTAIRAPSLLRVLLSIGVIELPVQAEDETGNGPLPHAGVLIFDPLNQRTATRILRYLNIELVIKQSVVVDDDILYIAATPDGNKHALRRVHLPPGHILSPTIPRLPPPQTASHSV